MWLIPYQTVWWLTLPDDLSGMIWLVNWCNSTWTVLWCYEGHKLSLLSDVHCLALTWRFRFKYWSQRTIITYGFYELNTTDCKFIITYNLYFHCVLLNSILGEAPAQSHLKSPYGFAPPPGSACPASLSFPCSACSLILKKKPHHRFNNFTSTYELRLASCLIINCWI